MYWNNWTKIRVADLTAAEFKFASTLAITHPYDDSHVDQLKGFVEEHGTVKIGDAEINRCFVTGLYYVTGLNTCRDTITVTDDDLTRALDTYLIRMKLGDVIMIPKDLEGLGYAP